MALFRIYSSRKKSWAREPPTFPASVTAERGKKKIKTVISHTGQHKNSLEADT